MQTFSTGFPSPCQVSCLNPGRTQLFTSCMYFFYFWAGSFLIYQNGLESGKGVDVPSENVLYFNFWVSCLYTFNPLPLLLKWVTTLVGTTWRNMQSRHSRRTTYMMRIKESQKRPFFLIFRRNIVLHDSYKADENVIEMEEWKQNVPGVCVKRFSRVLLSALETSIVC